MKSIGQKLRNRREQKLHQIDQAARETHISKRFIEAMEEERFDVFPGESYLIGFLRSYAEYLELDSNEIIKLYQNTQIQEQPIPVEELLESRRRPNIKLILGIVAAVAVIGTGTLLLTFMGEPSRRSASRPPESAEDIGEEFSTIPFTGEILEQEFQAATIILIPFKENTYSLELRKTGNPLELFFDDQSFTIEESTSGFIDLDREGNPDLRVIFKSSMPNGNPVLRFDRVVAGASVETSSVETNADENRVNHGGVRPGSTNNASRVLPVQTLGQFSQPETVFAEILFRGPVLFRYLDENGESQQRLLNSGERFQTEFSEYMYIWLSNAGKVQFSLAGKVLRLGADGEVAAYKIAWNDSQLELIPMY